MAGYQGLIVAHGVIAAIVFLGLVPAAILIARYYSLWDRYWAFKLHAWLHVMTLLLTTVVFVLGYFAVGPKRTLTNPHHGIGLAIYVMVVFQVFWGWLIHKLAKGMRTYRVPLAMMVCFSHESSLPHGKLIPPSDPSLDRSRMCDFGNRPNSSRIDPIWFP